MNKIVYTLKIKDNTDEFHLFEATVTSGSKCTPKSKSICRKMKKSESTGNKFACKDEDAARKNIANIGRSVCGTCVSHLYETY